MATFFPPQSDTFLSVSFQCCSKSRHLVRRHHSTAVSSSQWCHRFFLLPSSSSCCGKLLANLSPLGEKKARSHEQINGGKTISTEKSFPGRGRRKRRENLGVRAISPSFATVICAADRQEDPRERTKKRFLPASFAWEERDKKKINDGKCRVS